MFHNLTDLINWYNTRDTNPAAWYPTVKGVVQKLDDLPARFRANLDKQGPLDGRSPGSTPPMTREDMDDLEAFLNTLTDDYQPDAASAPAHAQNQAQPAPSASE